MSKTINVWYINKYSSSTNNNLTVGNRGLLLMKYISKKGYNVHLINSGNNHLIIKKSNEKKIPENNSENIFIHTLKTISYKKPNSIKRIISWIHFEILIFLKLFKKIPDPNIVIVSSPSLLTVISGLLIKLLLKSKLIFEVRDIWPLALTEEGGFKKNNLFILFFKLVERTGYNFSNYIVGTMPRLDLHIKRNYPKIKTPVSSIPMGICIKENKRERKLDKEYIQKYYPSNKFIIGYLGTIGSNNALEILLETASSLKKYTKIHFLLIGNGASKYYLQKKYAHLKNISFAPGIDKDLVKDAIQNLDLTFFSVYPSIVWDYGFSLNKIIDYMEAGKPILGSYSGYQTMINEADCGFIVPSGNLLLLKEKIIELSKYPKSLLRKKGLNGKKWLLANRSYEELANQYIKIFKKILK